MSALLTNPQDMQELLESWAIRGWLREVDVALVRFLREEVPAMPSALMLATALVSHQLGRGHVCLDLQATIDDPYMALSLPPDSELVTDQDNLLQPKDVLQQLSISNWVAALGHSELVSSDEGNSPLVLVGHRLYLRRYWRYERQVEAAITSRMEMSEKIGNSLPLEKIRDTLDALFPEKTKDKTAWHKVACALAARSAFSIITGGPGTGKTTTVVRLLALLQSIALTTGTHRPLEIRLAAPTGKAAARLKESIAGAIGRLPDLVQSNQVLKESIPSEVTTLHRLLGTQPGSRFFRHDARNPLSLDILVVDEGSMVDLEMMAAMLQALPTSARLILLGDKDQLASVEAGSVLGEFCRRADRGYFTPDTAAWVLKVTGQQLPDDLIDPQGTLLDQHIVMLRESKRFEAQSGTGQLAAAVNSGQTSVVREVWDKGYPDLAHLQLATLDDSALTSLVVGTSNQSNSPPGLTKYIEVITTERPQIDSSREDFDRWAWQVLEAHGRFQLLCALRNGAYGVSGMNQRIEEILKRHNLINPSGIWYEGRPVLITRNDYQLALMNGDIGITLPYPVLNERTGELSWTLRVAFPIGEGKQIRWVLPSRLLSAETVFALTVHKSQGSEFEHCVLLLPPKRNPVLTRELVYTGITRGKRWFTLISTGDKVVLEDSVTRTVQRSGGLFRAGD